MGSLPCDYVPWYTQLYLRKVALVIFAMALPLAANKMDTNLNQAGCGELGSNGRIYNGKPISNEKMPWIVQITGIFHLWTNHISSCGGSIITRNLILTAAHCLFNKGAFAQMVLVVYSSNLYMNGKTLLAEKMILHPKYVNKLVIQHDVALLKLAVDLVFDRRIKPVCLPTAKMDLAGKTLVVAGWGRTESANNSKILLHAEVVALADDVCQALLRRTMHPITRRPLPPGPAICASGENQSVCRGDSGGPLTLTNDDGRTLQVGVVSAGVRCPSDSPGMYRSVSSHIKWIQSALNHPRKWRQLAYTRKEGNIGEAK
ncbi:chymotrypsinogen A-like [Dermacentor andersoni]|uniref:chymotrypsinogen A-like n=1 Tax=Dermacentor andersoni TaxID=34620 RepID=UPI002417BEE6|nr:chymotrypsinogen A-like isoform X3 [Dermacentor andersoni]